MSGIVDPDVPHDLGPYRLLGIVARDAETALCTAVHRQDGHHRLLKLVLPGGLPGSVVRRFLRQARVLASIAHPGVCPTLESGRLPAGGAYAALPLIEGESLHQWLNRVGSLKTRPALAAVMVAALADACSALAAEGIVHGDVRPAHVRLVPDAGTPHRFVLRLTGSEEAGLRAWRLARLDQPAPAAPYRAPELGRPGACPDVPSDIHSLGCLFFELVTGMLPFGQADRGQRQPPDLAALVPGIAPEMQRSIGRMLAEDPSDRYQSMDEIVTAVELMLGRHRSRFAELQTSELPLLPPEPPSVSTDLAPLASAFADDCAEEWISRPLGTLRGLGAAARDALARRLLTLRRQTAGSDGRPTVLVAEDDDDTRQSIVELLEDNGYRVIAARHGGEAQEHLRSGLRAACMLMDLWMPEMDGWTLAAEMQQGRLPAVPTIVMTAAEPHWGYPCPIVVRKPFDSRHLLGLVKTVSASSAARDDAGRTSSA
jgi:CheY-like chemotaxis protein